MTFPFISDRFYVLTVTYFKEAFWNLKADLQHYCSIGSLFLVITAADMFCGAVVVYGYGEAVDISISPLFQDVLKSKQQQAFWLEIEENIAHHFETCGRGGNISRKVLYAASSQTASVYFMHIASRATATIVSSCVRQQNYQILIERRWLFPSSLFSSLAFIYIFFCQYLRLVSVSSPIIEQVSRRHSLPCIPTIILIRRLVRWVKLSWGTQEKRNEVSFNWYLLFSRSNSAVLINSN